MPSDIQTLGTLSVFPFYPNYKDGIGFTVESGFTAVMFSPYMPVQVVQDTDEKQLVLRENFIFYSKEERSDFLDFIDSHKGQLKKFWLYVNTNEFTLKQTIALSSTSANFYNSHYANSFKEGDRIYFVLNNSDVIVRKIESAGYDSLSDELYLYFTTAMPAYAIAPADIAEIGRVICCRFDIDNFSLQHKNVDVAEISLRFIELPKEYPA